MHHERIDEKATKLLITDDETIELLTPSNGGEFCELVVERGHVPFGAKLEYEHAPALLQEWTKRLSCLRDKLAEHPFSDSLPAQLWEETMRRQTAKVSLAVGLAFGYPTVTALEELYGRPSRDAFWSAVAEMRGRAEGAVGSDRPLIRCLAQGVLNRLPMVPSEQTPPSDLPEQATVDAVRAWLMPIASPWLEAVDCLGLQKGDKADAGQIAAVFADILGSYDLGAVVDEGVTSITFQPSRRRLAVPSGRQMTAAILAKTVVHEMVHVRRYLGGERGSLALGQFGLPAYLPFEEGVATALAEIATSKKPIASFARPEAYVAIGLASGLDPKVAEGWSMDWVFQLMWRHYAIIEAVIRAKKGELDENQLKQKGMEQAATRVLRTFRGAVCGGACPRDLSYRDGCHAFWQWAAGNLGELDLLLSAKADLTQKHHRRYVQTLV